MMKQLTKKKILPQFTGRKSQKGAKLVEYGLIAGLISVTSIGAIYYNGTSVRNVFCVAGNSLGEKVLIPMGMDYETFPGCSPTVAEPTDPVEPVTPVSPTYDPQDPNFVMIFGQGDDATTVAQFAITASDANGLIEWGDGTTTNIASGYSGYTHNYSDSAEYTVNISGTNITTFLANNPDNLYEVVSFGNMGLQTLQSAFQSTHNLRAIADLPDTVTDLDYTFRYSEAGLEDIYDWNTSNVTSMTGTFRETPNLAADLQYWDVTGVTSLRYTFHTSGLTDNGVGNWDVSNITTFREMFQYAPNFNADLNSWDVSKGTTFLAMFEGATSFNGNVSDWTFLDDGTDIVLNAMFENASSFNQSLNAWDVSQVDTFNSMFEGATSFNQPLDAWDVTKADTQNGASAFYEMFREANSMSQDLSSWCVANTPPTPSNFATNTATGFQQPLWGTCSAPDFTNAIELVYNPGATISIRIYGDSLIDWGDGLIEPVNGTTASHTLATGGEQTVRIINANGSSVTRFTAQSPDLIRVESFGDVGLNSLQDTFMDAANLASVPNTLPPAVTSLNDTFNNSDGIIAGVENWDVSNVDDFYRTFYNANNFNRDISGWEFGTFAELGTNIRMDQMLRNATSFNQPLNSWDVSNTTSFVSMFNGASNFNQPLNNWDVSQVTLSTGLGNMFNDATSFSQDLTSWCVNDLDQPSGFSSNTNNMVEPLWGFCGPPDFIDPIVLVFQGGASVSIRIDGIGVIDWGDGTLVAGENENLTHTLASGGNQTVRIDAQDGTGSITSFQAQETTLLAVSSFGDVGLTNLVHSLRDTDNLASVPSTLPSGITDLSNAFYHSNGTFAGVENWDVSNVDNFYRMFAYAENFNRDLSNWDFGTYAELGSKVSLSNLFRDADSFNNGGSNGINNWDVSNVNDFNAIFYRALSFNQPLNNWDVRSANDAGSTAFNYMFNGANQFVQSLTSWCVDNVNSTPTGFTNGLLTEPNWNTGSCPAPIE